MTGKVLWEFDPDGTGDRQKMVRAYFNGRLFTSTGDAAAGSHTVYTDHLGTPRLKLHVMTAAAEARDDYYPFGQQVNTVVDAAHDRRFTGKERDAESGLDYFGARYYHSVAGRFLSVDPSRESLAIKNPQSLNRYTYVLNSPLKLKDPDGKAAVLATLAIGAGTDVGLQVALNVLQGDAWHKDVGTAVVTGAVAGATGFGLVKIAQKSVKVVKAYRAASAAKTAQGLLLPSLKLRDNKLIQHAHQWGIGQKGVALAPRQLGRMRQFAKSIYKNRREIRQGVWGNPKSGGFKDALFYSNGKDLVVTKSDGTLITILKNATKNKHFKKAKTIWEQ